MDALIISVGLRILSQSHENCTFRPTVSCDMDRSGWMVHVYIYYYKFTILHTLSDKLYADDKLNHCMRMRRVITIEVVG